MQCIIFSGIDGSGKTSVINELRKDLEIEGFKTKYVWLRFNHFFAKILHALARVIGLSVKVNNEMGTVWEHRFYKSNIFCYFYILATYLDSLISLIKYLRAAKNVDYIICDRWINDIIIDLGSKIRNDHFLDTRWFDRFQSILPVNAKQFVISRNINTVLKCRLENRLDPAFKYRISLYNKLEQNERVIVVNNNGTVNESVSFIKKIIVLAK